MAPVVLVHPVGLDLTYWSAQIIALSGDYDVLAFDLPGQGSSPGNPKDWTIEQTSSFVDQVVETTECSSVHLVGLSVGGIIALAYTIARPEAVCPLTLLSTAPTFSPAARDAMRARAAKVRSGGMRAVLQECLERWFTPSTIEYRPDLIDRVKKTLLADDPEVHGAMWDMISAFDIVSELATIKAPTLIVTGALDQSSPPSAAELLREKIVASEFHVVPQYSHILPFEAPEIVNSYLLPFLRTHSEMQLG